MGIGEICTSARREAQSHFLFVFRSLVITSTIFEEIRGRIVCGRVRSINGHVEQERSDSAGLDIVRVSRNPTTVSIATGEVQSHGEATVYVHDFEFFVTVQIFHDFSCSPIAWKIQGHRGDRSSWEALDPMFLSK